MLFSGHVPHDVRECRPAASDIRLSGFTIRSMPDITKVVSLDFYRHITTNALMSNDVPIERKKGAKCPTTVVEGRNAFFLLAAAVWAKGLGNPCRECRCSR